MNTDVFRLAGHRSIAGTAAALLATGIVVIPASVGHAAPVITAEVPAKIEADLVSLIGKYIQATSETQATVGDASFVASTQATKLEDAVLDGSTELMGRVFQAQKSALQAKRADLAKAGVAFSKVETSLDTVETVTTPSGIQVTITDNTVFTPVDPGEPTTEQSLDRMFEFHNIGGKWLLSQSSVLGDGEAPMGAIAPEFAAQPLDSKGLPVSDDPEDNGGTLGDVDKAEDKNWVDPTVPTAGAGGSKPEDSRPREKQSAASVAGAKPFAEGSERAAHAVAGAIPKNLCYSCMITYADAHWKHYHKAFRSFAKKGGD